MNKEANSNDVSIITNLVFAIFILIIIIGTCFVGIVISRGKDLEVVIGILSNVGGAISGITSPMLGIVTIVFVYMAYNQQLTANNLLKSQIDQINDFDLQRLKISKELILLDLKDNIISDLKKFSKHINEFQNRALSTNTIIIVPDIKYAGLSLDIYNSVGVESIYKIFNSDVLKISSIYRNVEYLNSIVLTEIYGDYNKALNAGNTENIICEIVALNKNMQSITMTIDDAIKKANEILSKNSNSIL